MVIKQRLVVLCIILFLLIFIAILALNEGISIKETIIDDNKDIVITYESGK